MEKFYHLLSLKQTQMKRSLGSKFENKPETAVSGTIHTVTTGKTKVIHRKLTSNPLTFQSTVTPTKRINTRMTTTVEKPSCSKAGGQATCSYRSKEPPRPSTESSADCLKCKDQSRNERGQFTSPNKSAGKPMDLDPSMVSNDDFQCYNIPVLKENRFTPIKMMNCSSCPKKRK